jgi:hypothetical protein
MVLGQFVRLMVVLDTIASDKVFKFDKRKHEENVMTDDVTYEKDADQKLQLFHGIENAKDKISEELHAILGLTFDITDVQNLEILQEEVTRILSTSIAAPQWGVADKLQSPSREIENLNKLLSDNVKKLRSNDAVVIKEEIAHTIEFLKTAAAELFPEEKIETPESEKVEQPRNAEKLAGTLRLTSLTLDIKFGDLPALVELHDKLEKGVQLEQVVQQFKPVQVTQSRWLGLSSTTDTALVPVPYTAIEALQNHLCEISASEKSRVKEALALFINGPENQRYLTPMREAQLEKIEPAIDAFYKLAKNKLATFQKQADQLLGRKDSSTNGEVTVDLGQWKESADKLVEEANKLLGVLQAPCLSSAKAVEPAAVGKAKALHSIAREVVNKVTKTKETIAAAQNVDKNYKPPYEIYVPILVEVRNLTNMIATNFPSEKPKQLESNPVPAAKTVKQTWFAGLKDTIIFSRSSDEEKQKLAAKAKYTVSIPLAQSKQTVKTALLDLLKVIVEPYNDWTGGNESKQKEAVQKLETALQSAKEQGAAEAKLEEKVQTVKAAVTAAVGKISGLTEEASGDDARAASVAVEDAKTAISRAYAAVDSGFIDIDTEYAATVVYGLLQAKLLTQDTVEPRNLGEYRDAVAKLKDIAEKINGQIAGEKGWHEENSLLVAFYSAVKEADTAVAGLNENTPMIDAAYKRAEAAFAAIYKAAEAASKQLTAQHPGVDSYAEVRDAKQALEVNDKKYKRNVVQGLLVICFVIGVSFLLNEYVCPGDADVSPDLDSDFAGNSASAPSSMSLNAYEPAAEAQELAEVAELESSATFRP